MKQIKEPRQNCNITKENNIKFVSPFQVQPGQSKTIAYKQVSYQYNKSLDGKSIGKFMLIFVY